MNANESAVIITPKGESDRALAEMRRLSSLLTTKLALVAVGTTSAAIVFILVLVLT